MRRRRTYECAGRADRRRRLQTGCGESRALQSCPVVRPTVRIECAVPKIFVEAPVELACACPGGQADNSSIRLPVLCVEGNANYQDFLGGFNTGQQKSLTNIAAGDRYAVNQNCGLLVPSAVEGEARFIVISDCFVGIDALAG